MLLCRLILVAFFLLLPVQPSGTAAAAELLRNGGFEQGASGWRGTGISTSGCEPHSGSGALALASDGSTAFAQQNVAGPLGHGSYSLAGSLMVQSGSPQVEVSLIWLDDGGSELSRNSQPVSAGGSYGGFRVRSSLPAGAASLRVRISLNTAVASIACLDDVSLDGPPPPTPAATVTASPTPTPANAPAATATPPPTSTPGPTSTLTPRPTSTPRPRPTATLRPAPTAPVAPTLPLPAPPSPAAPIEPQTARDESGGDPPATLTPAASAQPTGTGPDGSEPVPSHTPTQEARSFVFGDSAANSGEEPPRSLTRPPSDDEAVPAIWLLTTSLFAVVLGGNYVFRRHRD